MCSSHELIPLKKAFPELAKLIRIAISIFFYFKKNNV